MGRKGGTGGKGRRERDDPAPPAHPARPAPPASPAHQRFMSAYIELHTASAFSFLQGASLPEALVDRAADLGYSALALLDRDGVYGAPRFHKAALAAGVRPIIGAELTVAASLKAQGSRLNASDVRLDPAE